MGVRENIVTVAFTRGSTMKLFRVASLTASMMVEIFASSKLGVMRCPVEVSDSCAEAGANASSAAAHAPGRRSSMRTVMNRIPRPRRNMPALLFIHRLGRDRQLLRRGLSGLRRVDELAGIRRNLCHVERQLLRAAVAHHRDACFAR